MLNSSLNIFRGMPVVGFCFFEVEDSYRWMEAVLGKWWDQIRFDGRNSAEFGRALSRFGVLWCFSFWGRQSRLHDYPLWRRSRVILHQRCSKIRSTRAWYFDRLSAATNGPQSRLAIYFNMYFWPVLNSIPQGRIRFVVPFTLYSPKILLDWVLCARLFCIGIRARWGRDGISRGRQERPGLDI